MACTQSADFPDRDRVHGCRRRALRRGAAIAARHARRSVRRVSWPLFPRWLWRRAQHWSSSSTRATARGDDTSFATARRPRSAARRASSSARPHYEAGKIVGVTHAITHHQHASPELDDVSLVRKVESELFRDPDDSQRTDQHQRRPRDRSPARAARRPPTDPAHRARRAPGRGRPRRREPAPPARGPSASKPPPRRPARDAQARVTPRTTRTTNSTPSRTS